MREYQRDEAGGMRFLDKFGETISVAIALLLSALAVLIFIIGLIHFVRYTISPREVTMGDRPKFRLYIGKDIDFEKEESIGMWERTSKKGTTYWSYFDKGTEVSYVLFMVKDVPAQPKAKSEVPF